MPRSILAVLALAAFLAAPLIVGCDGGADPQPTSTGDGQTPTPSATPPKDDGASGAGAADTPTAEPKSPDATPGKQPNASTDGNGNGGGATGSPDQSTSTKPKADDKESTAGKVSDTALQVNPIGVGQPVPQVTLKSADGIEVALPEAIKDKPTILVFYRGGWCPFCQRHLSGVAQAQTRLRELGYQIIAISPDSPDNAAATASAKALGYTLLSDMKAEAITAFGLAFKVDDETLKRYAGFGIDLEAAAGGEKHHILPVPAVYIIGADGAIKFVHFDPNYSERLPSDKLVEEAQLALYRK